MEFREIRKEELNYEFFKSFNRYQEVTKCWRKIDGEWVIRDIVFTEQWDKETLIATIEEMKSSQIVYGALDSNKLVGFAALESDFFGDLYKYLQLSMLHVSYEYRGNGIGRKLFQLTVDNAKRIGADKLYISAHSSVESQAFYKSIGCVEALEYNTKLVELEPYDCQLEYII